MSCFRQMPAEERPACILFPQMQPPLVRPNPPFVAFRVSALSRASIMARMLRDASRSSLLPTTAQLLSPRLASMLFPPILVPALIGELSFAVWLTVKGVNVAIWQEKKV